MLFQYRHLLLDWQKSYVTGAWCCPGTNTVPTLVCSYVLHGVSGHSSHVWWGWVKTMGWHWSGSVKATEKLVLFIHRSDWFYEGIDTNNSTLYYLISIWQYFIFCLISFTQRTMFSFILPNKIIDETHAKQTDAFKSRAETVGCTQETIQGHVIKLKWNETSLWNVWRANDDVSTNLGAQISHPHTQQCWHSLRYGKYFPQFWCRDTFREYGYGWGSFAPTESQIYTNFLNIY